MNEGCIPTKALLRSAEVMHLVQRRAHEFGVRGVDPEKVHFDLAAAVARKDRVVGGVIEGIYTSLRRNQKVQLLRGRARFKAADRVLVDGQEIGAGKVILAVGARPVIPEIPGLKEAGYLTNDEALRLEALPESMVVIGAGYVGVEFAQMYARYGTRVTLLQRGPHILPGEEEELVEELEGLLRREGVDLRTRTEAVRVSTRQGKKVVVGRGPDGGEEEFTTSQILVAAGRFARVEELELERAEVELGPEGVLFDEQLRTTNPRIWSIGDGNGGHMFTHRATYDGPYAALNAVRDLGRTVDYRVVPRAVFTEPALASVGLTEAQAHQRGHDVATGSFPFASSGKAKAIGMTAGKVKVVADRKTQEILGFHILGPDGDNLIHEAVVAMYDHGTLEPIARSIHVHPTLSEAVKAAAKRVR